MRSSKAQIPSRVHAIPAIRFTDQTLTSASGLVLIHALFNRFELRDKLGSPGMIVGTSILGSSSKSALLDESRVAFPVSGGAPVTTPSHRDCETTPVEHLPWALPNSGFTMAFEEI